MDDDVPEAESLDDIFGDILAEPSTSSSSNSAPQVNVFNNNNTFNNFFLNDFEQEEEEKEEIPEEQKEGDLNLLNILLENELLTPAFQSVFEQRKFSEYQLV
jgi:hypothetical protein